VKPPAPLYVQLGDSLTPAPLRAWLLAPSWFSRRSQPAVLVLLLLVVGTVGALYARGLRVVLLLQVHACHSPLPGPGPSR
jgi:hypothetical protein